MQSNGLHINHVLIVDNQHLYLLLKYCILQNVVQIVESIFDNKCSPENKFLVTF
jgi:hypothetical protein